MAISKCKELIVSRKRFSDFTLFDPASKEDLDNIFLAGYIEDEDGNRENIKMKASTFIDKSVIGTAIGTLDFDKDYEGIEFTSERITSGDGKIKIINIDSDASNFIQINTFNEKLFSEFENGKDYASIRLSPNITFGTIIRFYFPNFPTNKGIMLWPTSNKTAINDEPVEVFFNDLDEAYISDFYFTLIQLADPQDEEGKNIVTKTKVIEVNNITQEL